MSSERADGTCGGGLLFVVSAPRAPARRRWSSGWCRSCPDLALSRSYTSRAGRGRAKPTASTIISLPATRFEDDGRGGRLPRVGGRLRQLLRHLRGRHRARARGRARPGARDRRPGRPAGADAVPGTVGVFVLPPSFAVLEQRLRGRSKDTEEAMQRRLRPRATRSPPSSSTTTWSSTTSSTPASSGCARSCWPSGRGCGRCERRPKRLCRRLSRDRRVNQRRVSVIDRSTTNAFEFVISPARAPGSCWRAARRGRRAATRWCELAQKEVREGKVAKVAGRAAE